MFHQSGGCCDGSSPMCYPRGEFRVGSRDVLMGEIAGCPFYMGKDSSSTGGTRSSRSMSCRVAAVASRSKRRAACAF